MTDGSRRWNWKQVPHVSWQPTSECSEKEASSPHSCFSHWRSSMCSIPHSVASLHPRGLHKTRNLQNRLSNYLLRPCPTGSYWKPLCCCWVVASASVRPTAVINSRLPSTRVRLPYERQGDMSTIANWHSARKQAGSLKAFRSPFEACSIAVPWFPGADLWEFSIQKNFGEKCEGQVLRRRPQGIASLVSVELMGALRGKNVSNYDCYNRYFGCSAIKDDGQSSIAVSDMQRNAEEDVGKKSNEETLNELLKGRVPEWLLKRVLELGFVMPTRVQQEALPVVFTGRDCIIHAQTGSGKTLVYLLPLIANIDTRRSAVQALVVVPTRELGMQVAKVARLLGGMRVAPAEERDNDDALLGKLVSRRDSKRFSVMIALEGTGPARVKGWLKAEPPQLVVGMPERLLKMISNKTLRTNALQYVVVDEVDAVLERMKKKGSSHLHQLLAAVGPCRKHQTLLLSATVPQHHHFVSYCIQNKWANPNLLHIHVQPEEKLPSYINHHYVICAESQRLEMLRRLIMSDKPRAAIIFANEHSEKGRRAGTLPSAQLVTQFLTENRVDFPVVDHSVNSNDGDIKRNFGASGEFSTSATGRMMQHAENCRAENQEPRTKEHPLSGKVHEFCEEFGSMSGEPVAVKDDETEETWKPLLLSEEADINARVHVLEEFRNRARRLLVTTDFAGRGLDIPVVSHVYNFDLPSSAIAYVHRGGRTGRAPIRGDKGIVTTLATNKEAFVLRRLWSELQITAEEIIPS